ncbi:MAG: hypothetical protein OEZ43_18940 [Gammaproteobacteria bacterium]|nr:hypothetical protein [Gammaproteobacteria bacterium]
MTLGKLIQFLNQNTDYPYATGDGNALRHALDGSHPHALIGELLKSIAQHCACGDENCLLAREQVVLALGPIRLKYMADDAPAEGFRLIEKSICAIDDAFNQEALRLKG